MGGMRCAFGAGDSLPHHQCAYHHGGSGGSKVLTWWKLVLFCFDLFYPLALEKSHTGFLRCRSPLIPSQLTLLCKRGAVPCEASFYTLENRKRDSAV